MRRKRRSSITRDRVRSRAKPAWPTLKSPRQTVARNPKWQYLSNREEVDTTGGELKPGDLIKSVGSFNRITSSWDPTTGKAKLDEERVFKIDDGQIGLVIDGPATFPHYGVLYKVLFGDNVVIFSEVFLKRA